MPFRFVSRAFAIFAGAALLIIGGERTLHAQEAVTIQPVRVTGEEVPSSYGATPDFSRSRFSNLTQAYVLPPGSVFAGLLYQGDALRFNQPDHMLTQEVEIGLPARFGIAFEDLMEHYSGNTHEQTISI